MDSSDNQIDNTKDRPWLWKKGQSGNPKGRPKGKTLKEWAREYLMMMNDEERQEYLDGLPKEIIWKMAEGMPKQESKTELEIPQNIVDLIKYARPEGNPSVPGEGQK